MPQTAQEQRCRTRKQERRAATVSALAEAREHAVECLADVERDLSDALRDAYGAGLGVSELSRLSRLARPTVYDRLRRGGNIASRKGGEL